MTERSSTPKPHSGGKRRARAFADRSSSIWPKFSWWPVASEFELSDGENQGERCNWLGFERDPKRPVRESWFFRTSGAEGIAADHAAEWGTRQEFGHYDFGQWETNELARRLTDAGKTEAAIAILEMNGEFYPASAEIDVLIGEQYRRLGDREKAIQRYRAALAKSPQHGVAKQRLEELEKKPH